MKELITRILVLSHVSDSGRGDGVIITNPDGKEDVWEAKTSTGSWLRGAGKGPEEALSDLEAKLKSLAASNRATYLASIAAIDKALACVNDAGITSTVSVTVTGGGGGAGGKG